MNAAVVIVYPTERDGSIVRWYVSEAQALYGHEVASASPVRVCLEGASERVAAEAYMVHRQLRDDRHADVSWAASHRRLTIGLETELVRLDQAGPEREPVPLIARGTARLLDSASAREGERNVLLWLHAEASEERDTAREDLAKLHAVAARFAEQSEEELARRTAERDRAVRDADDAARIKHATWQQAQRLRGELAVSMGQTASNHAKLCDALGIEGEARDRIDPIATVRGLRDYIEHLKAEAKPGPSALVRRFHQAFDLPIGDDSRTHNAMRADLIREEAREAADALLAASLPSIAQELADLAYVTYGAALTLGIDLDLAVAEVHRANMSKLGIDGKPIMRGDGKVLKGPHYRAPDMTPALAKCGGCGQADCVCADLNDRVVR